MKKNNKKGFTLIEILVVIGIIAILAGVVLIAINPARQFASANDSQRASNINAILNAVGQYVAANQGALPAGITTTKAEVGAALCADLVPTFIPSLPTDPKSTKEGVAITTCADAVSGAVRYEIVQDANGRITVSAPLAELASTTVTR